MILIPELLLHIFSFLDTQSLLKADVVCKDWHALIENAPFWKIDNVELLEKETLKGRYFRATCAYLSVQNQLIIFNADNNEQLKTISLEAEVFATVLRLTATTLFVGVRNTASKDHRIRAYQFV